VTYIDVGVQGTLLSAVAAAGDEEWAQALDMGVPVQIGLWKPKQADLGFLSGLQLSWREDEEGQGLSRWEIPVEFAWRRYGASPGIRPYGELAAGPHLVLALPDYLPAVPDLALGLTVGVGAEAGDGPVRAVFGLRGRLVLSPWTYSGYALTAAGERSTSWTSSDGRVEAHAGVSFR
jgi:hypothetical protein